MYITIFNYNLDWSFCNAVHVMCMSDFNQKFKNHPNTI